MSFQKCPLCNGSGYDETVAISDRIPACPVCKGEKIISTITGLPPGKVEVKQPYFNIIEDKSLSGNEWYFVDTSGIKIAGVKPTRKWEDRIRGVPFSGIKDVPDGSNFLKVTTWQEWGINYKPPLDGTNAYTEKAHVLTENCTFWFLLPEVEE